VAIRLADMGWNVPEYTRQEVNEAGRLYVRNGTSPEEREIALAVMNNWRSSHSYPLNTWQMNLRKQVAELDTEPTVAQRIKRLPSIRHKLDRMPHMKLSQMQDLGGARAVLTSTNEVDALVSYYTGTSRIKHKLVKNNDYIARPKDSGYRGMHLVYSYNSDRRSDWNGLKIEIQIRSRLQHAWATAVETVGTFTQQALKSSWGDQEWLRFFVLMSSSLALREDRPIVPGTPEDPKVLARDLRRYVKKLKVIERLNAYGNTLRLIDQPTAKHAHAFLLELNTSDQTLTVRSYESDVVATEQYSAIERAIEGEPNKDVVLVRVGSLVALRRAYPNYFLDTTAFVRSVEEAIA